MDPTGFQPPFRARIRLLRGWWVITCSKNPKLVVIGDFRDSTIRRAEELFGVKFEENPMPEAA